MDMGRAEFMGPKDIWQNSQGKEETPKESWAAVLESAAGGNRGFRHATQGTPGPKQREPERGTN